MKSAMATNPQVPAPHTAAQVPAPATGVTIHAEYAKAVGRMAYIWGWPLVNQINRRAAITQAPEPGRLNGVLPVAPRGQLGMLSDYIDPGQNVVTCPNQDVVYGLGFFSLDEEPAVSLLAAVLSSAKDSADEQREKIRKMASQTLMDLYKLQPEAQGAIQQSAGYAVFSN